jgi:acyl-homoserine lactone acylase PvdQ
LLPQAEAQTEARSDREKILLRSACCAQALGTEHLGIGSVGTSGTSEAPWTGRHTKQRKATNEAFALLHWTAVMSFSTDLARRLGFSFPSRDSGAFMKNLVFILLAASSCFAAQSSTKADVARWEQQAKNITIIRDDWGIAHVYGKTDADAVFGAEYAQAEDDFNRVETNYINAIGRLAEAEGESKIYQDLRMKLFIDPEQMKKQYDASPAWLKKLMNAFADGLNYYLEKHPEVKPRVIARFEPWMALTFSEGSIGGDIERVNLKELQGFYGGGPVNQARSEDKEGDAEPTGSNGIAIAPSNTVDHHPLLLINPHTSFFFRSELQMVSDEGLNAYGAATWGQFFIYQGFNEHVGWMHTSSGVDAVDEYLETIEKKDNRFYYKYGNEQRPVVAMDIVVPYKTDHGMAQKKFTVYRTHHGPIIREVNGKWVSIRLMQEPVQQLTQSFIRTKAQDYKSYLQTMELKANSSNNTIFADADGDIAYFHGNFIPKRDTSFDWTKPVDGSNPATEWRGTLSIDETPHLLNPKSGWIYNSNNAPWSAAGPSSPKKEDYPAYVEMGGESARGLHAVRLLQNKTDFTLQSLIAAAYDSYLPWFEKPMAALIKAWDDTPETDPQKAKLADQIGILRGWDLRWGVTSVPTSLAVFWGEDIARQGGRAARGADISTADYVAKMPVQQQLASLAAASQRLASDFGTWKTPWGEINRYQRLTGDIVQPFNDSEPSIPVGFTSSRWGSLASFGARPYPGTKKWYGTSGNSFVAVVEFGGKVRAKAVTAGGESGHPSSSHFNDEAKRYSTGDLREVYFYRSQ